MNQVRHDMPHSGRSQAPPTWVLLADEGRARILERRDPNADKDLLQLDRRELTQRLFPPAPDARA